MNVRIIQLNRAAKVVLLVLLLCAVGMTNAYADSYYVAIGDLRYDLYDYDQSAEIIGLVNGTSATGELVIPESVTYEGISYSVTMIGSQAFYGCSGFTGDLTIPNSVIWIGDYAFYNCSGFTGSLTLSNSLTTIGYRAFYGCSGFTGSLTIPNTVTTIEERAFAECTGFTGNLIIPDSMTYTGTVAFAGCSGLTSVTIPSSVTSISLGSFARCSGLTSITIPNSVTSIGSEAFISCSGLVSIDIPNSVTSIGNRAFQWCSGLVSIFIPNSITSIQTGTFYECTGLTSITIPSSVASIGYVAFRNCTGLRQMIVFAETPPSLSSEWGSFDNDIRVYVPCGAIDDYTSIGWGGFSHIFGMCGGTVEVIANPSEGGNVSGGGTFEAYNIFSVMATANEGYAFGNWTINGYVVSIDNEYTQPVAGDMTLVANFVQTGNINFADDNVKAICVENWDTNSDGELSYAEAAKVTRLNVFNEYYGDFCPVFNGDETLTSFDELQYFISLNSIETYSFGFCIGLTSITIPNFVSYIGESAFYECSNLTSLTVLAEVPPTLDYDSFGGVNKDIPVYVLCGSLSAYQNADGWNEFTNIQEDCSQTQTQTINLTQGTNWVSFNVEITLDDLKAVLAATGGTNIVIKAKNSSTTWNGHRWLGALNGFDVYQMYQVKVETACQITLEGVPIAPAEHPVTISNGVNWIGFPLNESRTLSEAFAGFPAQQDVVKSKAASATWNGQRWVGQLTNLMPGQGYIYKSSQSGDRTFTIPTGAK